MEPTEQTNDVGQKRRWHLLAWIDFNLTSTERIFVWVLSITGIVLVTAMILLEVGKDPLSEIITVSLTIIGSILPGIAGGWMFAKKHLDTLAAGEFISIKEQLIAYLRLIGQATQDGLYRGSDKTTCITTIHTALFGIAMLACNIGKSLLRSSPKNRLSEVNEARELREKVIAWMNAIIEDVDGPKSPEECNPHPHLTLVKSNPRNVYVCGSCGSVVKLSRNKKDQSA